MSTKTATKFTAQDYKTCAEALSKRGWICTGHEEVTWTGRFEKPTGDGKRPLEFWLNSKTVGSRAFQTALGL